MSDLVDINDMNQQEFEYQNHDNQHDADDFIRTMTNAEM